MDYRAWDQDSVFPAFSDPFFPAHLARYDFAVGFLKRKTVLDLGCGKGYGSFILAGEASSVTAIDLNPDSIAFAKKNYGAGNLQFQLIDSEILAAQKPASFDAVTSFEVLEHLAAPEARQFLMTISKLLKTDGALFISTPNHAVVLKSGMPVPEFHINNLTSKELKAVLQEHFRHVEMFGQIQAGGWMQTAIYYLDVLSLRHSSLIKRLRRRTQSAGNHAEKQVESERKVWHPEAGLGPAKNFRFSKFLWRQAGMSFAICRGPHL